MSELASGSETEVLGKFLKTQCLMNEETTARVKMQEQLKQLKLELRSLCREGQQLRCIYNGRHTRIRIYIKNKGIV